MSFKKDIILTVKDYNTSTSSNLKFYKNDSLELNFSIEEYGIEIFNNVKKRIIMPINPLQATLIIQNPNMIDTIESVSIVDNIIKFRLTKVYTQYVGISKLQIILKDKDGCRLTIPEFDLEVKEGIGEEGNAVIEEKIIIDNEGNDLSTNDDYSIEYTGIGTTKKKIRDLIETTSINDNDFFIVEQIDGTKKIKHINIKTLIDTSSFATKEELKIKADKSQLDTKIDKVTGKGLSTNDFTNELKTKLEGLQNHTNAINTLISNKYDNVILTSTSLKFYANNVVKKTIELPTVGGSGGTNGKDGREIELSVQSGYISWRYVGESYWINLVSIVSLKGDKGDRGEQGIQGAKGETGLIGATGKSIEYVWRGTELGIRQQGQIDYTYVNLKGQTGSTGATGNNGLNGDDGKNIELQKTSTHIQWRLVGASTWTNLVAVTEIKGEQGLRGETGITGATGSTGKTPNIQIGTVTTLNPNQSATVTKTGTTDNPIFNFGIPKGDKGDNGDSGSGSSGKDIVADYILSGCDVIPITNLNMSTGIFTTTTNLTSLDGANVNLVLKPSANMDLNKTLEEFCNYNNNLTLQKQSNTTFKMNSKSSYKANSKLDTNAFEFQKHSSIVINNINHTEDCIYKVKVVGTRGRSGQTYIRFNTNKGSLMLNPYDGKPIQYVDIDCEFTVLNGLITAKNFSIYKQNKIGSASVGWDLGVSNASRDLMQFDTSTPLTITDIRVEGAFNNGTRVIIWRE